MFDKKAKKFFEDCNKVIAESEKKEEKRITKDEFDKAVIETMEHFSNEDKLEGPAKLAVTLSGTMFASKMKQILFD